MSDAIKGSLSKHIYSWTRTALEKTTLMHGCCSMTFITTESLTEREACRLGWALCSGQWTLLDLLVSASFLKARVTDRYSHAWLICGHWGFELRSSCSYSKRFCSLNHHPSTPCLLWFSSLSSWVDPGFIPRLGIQEECPPAPWRHLSFSSLGNIPVSISFL